MPSIFYEDGSGSIKCVLKEATFTQLSGLGAGHFLLLQTNLRTTSFSIKSTCNTEIQVFLVNNDPLVSNHTKQAWLKLANGDSFSSESFLPPQFYIPAGTQIWLKPVGADHASGKISLMYFGG